MFHGVTGIPFGSDLHSGAYDELTLWEQIDEGAQYTPAKKWLLCLPIGLYVFFDFASHSALGSRNPSADFSFLASTHYTNYNPWLFAINLTSLILVLIPKLPQVCYPSFCHVFSALTSIDPVPQLTASPTTSTLYDK